MKYFLLVSIFISILGYCQTENPMGSYEQALKISNYVYENFDSIVKHSPIDSLFILITFNADGETIKSIDFYKSKLLLMDRKVKAWREFDKFLYSLFEFHPAINSDEGLMRSQLFFSPLNRNGLKKQIKYIESEKSPFKQTKQIPPKAKYKILINNIYFDKYASTPDSLKRKSTKGPIDIKNMIFQSELEYLNSGLIKLSDNCHLIFRVLNTSMDGMPESQVDLKLYFEKELKYEYLESNESEFLSYIFYEANDIDGKIYFSIDLKIEFE